VSAMTMTTQLPPRLGTGIALVIAALALVAASIAEFAPGEIRGDGDNPGESIAYLRAAKEFYGYSGAALILGGSTLIAGVLGVARMVRTGGLSLAFGTATAFGILAGGFLAVAGVLRLNATGTVLHISDLDPGWGESAYLVVQMAGTQGLLATGMLGLCGWIVAVALLAVRRRLFALAPVGLPAAVILLVLASDALLPALGTSDAEWAYPVYVVAFAIGLPLGLLATGLSVLLPRAARRLAGG
jgi:hypothetical protein